MPVAVDNDANLAALGEHRLRFGDAHHSITVKAGTSIGSGIIVDGRLHRAGRVHDDAKTARFAEFRRVFKPLGARAEEAFETVFASPALSHAQLLSFCRRPSLFLELAPAC